ncbi:2-oxoglutarate dehydrogenase complex dihydrolipoyllysine-residue succinyltransferase [Methylocapsa palsarum]|uniref:Dihydrolipoyllysine-residue succinyltransferase component of 2-oxoglutarate dehydrogenase complex n=1 Tax=Methylocapsa palsarum TaxID=1612308 RepID=A0A1I4A248_9HYPH|nr:2-oxoglutarate dehydrogenase complex dihydrolipoyllysine-residue succinyltransferase [Methylocapsa palsarum]SFK50434.1 2-oxoglutarate dehydrogenase E2 component (dihydrolipoamide succinyltransferase) [Methylocapsa palsarum]
MTTEIRVPTLGESVTEATIGRWFKKTGDAVKADEPIVELETDKVTLEVNAPAAGVLAEITTKSGETVGVGALLGQIGEGVGTSAPKPAAAPAPTPAPTPAIQPPPPKIAAEAPSSSPAAGSPSPSPAAAKIAADRGLDPAEIDGSGKRGQVLKGDVLEFGARASSNSPSSNSTAVTAPSKPAAIPEPAAVPATEAKPADAPAAAPPPAPAPVAARAVAEPEREERIPMTRLRQTIARRLKDAQNTAAMLTTFNEVDMTEVMALRARYKDVFEKKHGSKLGFMGFFVKACVGALKDIPTVNAEIDGNDLVYKNYYHLGIAVGTEKGLVVPVVRDCDRLSLAGVEKTIADLGKRARDGQLKIDELQGGTFTITNGGIYGSLMSTPILNAPQSGILGMHKIQERPIAVAGKIEIRPMMYLALSYDHRIVDGKEAVTFLVRVKEALEDPARFLLDV